MTTDTNSSNTPSTELPNTTSITPKIANEASWVLRMLYAPENGQPARKLPVNRSFGIGKTIIENSIIEPAEQFPTDIFETTPEKYGPTLDNWDTIADYLTTHNLVRIATPSGDNRHTITLTENGISIAKQLFEELHPDYQHALMWLRSRYLSNDTYGLALSAAYLRHDHYDSNHHVY